MYKVNLLPHELQKEAMVDLKRLKKIAVITAVALLLGLGYGVFLLQWRSCIAEDESIEAQISAMAPTVQKVDALSQKMRNNNDNRKKLEGLLEERVALAPIIEDISFNLPVDMALTSIKTENGIEPELPGGFASPLPEGMKYIRPNQDKKESSNNQTSSTPSGDNQPTTMAGSTKEAPVDIGLKKLIVTGQALNTSSVGVLLNNMNGMPYFEAVKLRTIKDKKGKKLFLIEAYLIRGEEK